MRAELDALEALLGHHFRDGELLRRALTHRSLSSEQVATRESLRFDNEQLEFLGDSILGFLVSDLLVRRFPEFPEGRLSKRKAQLVSATHLHAAAQRLDLGCYLFLGRGEEMSGGRAKKALLANALEALIAAVYLDGGIEAARRIVLDHIARDEDLAVELGAEPSASDHKSALQEKAQALKLPPPHYSIVAEAGPEHAKTFTVEVCIGAQWSERAEGLSKKSASQKAARRLLERLAE